jgi:hypothetical protein
LERELASVYSKNSVHATPTEYIEVFRNEAEEEDRYEQAIVMANKLKSFALPDLHINIIVFRMVYNWSFGDISRELCIPSRQTAFNIYKRTLELLRERGYE